MPDETGLPTWDEAAVVEAIAREIAAKGGGRGLTQPGKTPWWMCAKLACTMLRPLSLLSARISPRRSPRCGPRGEKRRRGSARCTVLRCSIRVGILLNSSVPSAPPRPARETSGERAAVSGVSCLRGCSGQEMSQQTSALSCQDTCGPVAGSGTAQAKHGGADQRGLRSPGRCGGELCRPVASCACPAPRPGR